MLDERRFVVVGAGMVGRSLALALTARGCVLAAVASRRPESARAAAEAVGCGVWTTDAGAAARRGDVVVLSVPDDAIAPVCEAVALGGGFGPGDVAMHLSGACPSALLAAARDAGASALALHPVQTFARADGSLFDGITCALEGDPEAVARGAELARRLGGPPVCSGGGAKPLYHAALCIACNYLVTLADVGARLLAEVGFGEGALPALRPLLEGAVSNLARTGLPDALTGPIARADLATLRSHLAALQARAPGLVPLYRTVGLETAGLALRKGTIDQAQARAVRELLRGGQHADEGGGSGPRA